MSYPLLPDQLIFKTVSTAADALGVEAFVVGGYVRDLLLKRPSKDVDFVCVGSGIALANAVARLLVHARNRIVANRANRL